MAPADTSAGPSGSSKSTDAAVNELTAKVATLGHEDEQNHDDAEEGEDDSDHDDDVNGDAGTGGQGGEDGGKKKKKKKKRKSKAKSSAAAGTSQAEVPAVNVVSGSLGSGSHEDIKKALQAVDLMKLLENFGGADPNAGQLKEHKFWKTQPVIQNGETMVKEGPIDAPKTPADVRQEPYALPAGFEWSTVDVKNEEQMLEVHTLLTENYVEDDEAMFRFRYSKEFLLWALTAPGYLPEWHIGVRVQKTGKLVGFISGIKVELRAYSHTWDSAEINYLCVHKKLRSKRLAPVLIKEVTRRVNLTNIWQAIYTAGVVIPTPFSTCRYYHRNLNPPKLVDIGFSPLPRGSTIARLVRNYAMPTTTSVPGFREMKKEDVPQVGNLLRKYLSRFPIAQTFSTDEDIDHWFLSGQGHDVDGKRVEQVVWAYVVEDPTTKEITDMISFYSLPSTIMQHPKYNVLNAAYLFYYASDAAFSAGASSDDETKLKAKLDERLNALSRDMLTVAQTSGFDVMNALTLLDNNMFLSEQKFGPGDGYLNYYLYNWAMPPIDGGMDTTVARQGSGVGVVML
ncbi:Glycylpeptide N-tetradecanoyltransferase [Vanrija pseudolonga]|uniref:Glycylpeptide N-tetradecanoyltransferase n=1 Tax=Vanrija pseudolonga TaxID=143232 RepID=A0AAF1BFG4_9TREE|nr:Glycylpeptide N-tetradecanoyltransferase [Vanrija pseudolonga]